MSCQGGGLLHIFASCVVELKCGGNDVAWFNSSFRFKLMGGGVPISLNMVIDWKCTGWITQN